MSPQIDHKNDPPFLLNVELAVRSKGKQVTVLQELSLRLLIVTEQSLPAQWSLA